MSTEELEKRVGVLWDWMTGHKKEYEFMRSDVKEIKDGMEELRGLVREVKVLRGVMVVSIFAVAINIIVAIIT